MEPTLNNNAPTLQSIRQQVFAYRNGMTADALRRAGDPHHSIMGCQLTDLMTIAAPIAGNRELAEQLWAQVDSRECRLLATMVFPVEALTCEQALQLCHEVESHEVADSLCHKLLRHHPEASKVVTTLLDETTSEPDSLVRYTAYRLMLNLMATHGERPSDEVMAHLHHDLPATTGRLHALLADIEDRLN